MLWWGALGLISLLKLSESIRWPAGTYGIPKPTSGCPWADGFQWQEGWVSQDTNGYYSNNTRSTEFYLDGVVDDQKVNRSFCIKTSTENEKNRPTWPTGKYCIYRKNDPCPAGLESGYIYWDDDDHPNYNRKEGTLPDGEYYYTGDYSDTKIRFCCRTDGDQSVSVLLPSQTPFFLLAYESAKCQMVKWAIASLEWIYYDTEHHQNTDEADGEFPFEAGIHHPTIYYCYYRGCNETLTGVNGTFHSPNYPQKYPDGQYCSWRITVNPAQQIHLTFTNFSLQSENNTDSLYVYGGANATGEVLGVFYGGHPPPKEGIYSLSNHLFLIFKSDINGSYIGFSASYNAVNYSMSTVATTTTHVPEVTSSHTVTPKTLEKATSSREPPSKEGGNRKQKDQSQRKGVNMLAIVIPVVALVFIIALLVPGFFYCKRRRTKQEEQGTPKQVIYSRPNGETAKSLENPCYGRVKNTAFSSKDNEQVYAEVNEENKNEETYGQQESDNPLYETAGGDAVSNPIYDSSICS